MQSCRSGRMALILSGRARSRDSINFGKQSIASVSRSGNVEVIVVVAAAELIVMAAVLSGFSLDDLRIYVQNARYILTVKGRRW